MEMGEMTKKPLLGVKPAKLVVNDRNMDLANAIWNRAMQDTVSAADYLSSPEKSALPARLTTVTTI